MRKFFLAAVLVLMGGVVFVNQVSALTIANGSFQEGLTYWTFVSVDHVNWGEGGAVDLNGLMAGSITQSITLTSGDSGDYILSWDESANWLNSTNGKSYDVKWSLLDGNGNVVQTNTTQFDTGPIRAGWSPAADDLKYVSKSVSITGIDFSAGHRVLQLRYVSNELGAEGALIDNVQIPEASTALLLGLGLVGMTASRRSLG